MDKNKCEDSKVAAEKEITVDRQFVVVAIDFGSTYSGYMFSLKSDFAVDPTRFKHCPVWRYGACDFGTVKTISSILLNADKKFDSFGYEAEKNYSDMFLEDIGDTDASNPNKWYLFRNFKMELYNRDTLSKHFKIKNEQGKQMLAMDVFTSAIRYLKDHAMKMLKETADIEEKDIKWILTVPAIWTESAKQFMRQSAIQAGISGKNLLLALEPEVAAIYCKELEIRKNATIDLRTKCTSAQSTETTNKEQLNAKPKQVNDESTSLTALEPAEQANDRTQSKKVSPKTPSEAENDKSAGLSAFKPGSRFMVLDLGGGTVDVTVHEVQQNDLLHEIHKASGGAWGGDRVNVGFMNLWKTIIGPDNFETFLSKYQDDVILFRNSFESLKRQLKWNDKNRPSVIQLPDFFKTLESLESTVKEQYDNDITITRGKAKISYKLLESLFWETIECIITHIRDIFVKVTDIKSVLMVGGFSEAEIVKEAMKEAFPDIRFCIPSDCNSAVMKGAVMYGFQTEYIAQRISRYSYGISHRVPFDEELHPIIHKYTVNGKEMCEDVFKVFVYAGMELPNKTEIRHSFCATQNLAVIELYASSETAPKFTSDDTSVHIGDILITFPDFDTQRQIEVTMIYGNTEIDVLAVDVNTGRIEKSRVDLIK